MRPLWALYELGIDFELEVLPFPPRVFAKHYKEVNPLGTVPCLVDGDVKMTESSGICQYLVDKCGPTDLAVAPDEKDYGSYLNWLHRSDATLTFPQTLVLRYTRLEPDETKSPQVASDYRKWFVARARSVEAALNDHEFLCSDRFTIADVSIGYCFVLAQSLDIEEVFTPNIAAYYERLSARPAFQKAYDQPKE